MKTKLKNFLAASSQYVQACKDNLESFTKFFFFDENKVKKLSCCIKPICAGVQRQFGVVYQVLFFGNFMIFPKKKDS